MALRVRKKHFPQVRTAIWDIIKLIMMFESAVEKIISPILRGISRSDFLSRRPMDDTFSDTKVSQQAMVK